MRILMLAQFYPPMIGGEERHVRALSIELVRRGHDVAVATLWHAGMAEFEVDQGVRVYRIHGTLQRFAVLFSESGHQHAPSFPDPELMRGLHRVVIQEQPHIVHAHNWLLHSFAPLKAWSNARLLLTIHDHGTRCAKKKLIYNDAPCSGPGLAKCLRCTSAHYGPAKGPLVLLTNAVMSAFERHVIDKYLFVSHAVGVDNALIDAGLPVEVLPNFVADDIGTVSDVPHERLSELPAGDFMLFVGAFGRYKGIDVLAQAYARLEHKLPLVLIGYHTSDSPVRTTDFPAGITVLKDWPHAAVMQAWQRSLFGLIPSIWSDPCPTVAMEAMSMGRALIASRVGGLVDLVAHTESGLLVEPGDVDELQAAMSLLIRHPVLCKRMGEVGRSKVNAFRASSVVGRIEQIYSELLQKEQVTHVGQHHYQQL